MLISHLVRAQWDVVFRRFIVFMTVREKPAPKALGPKLRKHWERLGKMQLRCEFLCQLPSLVWI